MSSSTEDRLKDSLLRLSMHDKSAFMLSTGERSLSQNLSALLHLGMPMKELRRDDTTPENDAKKTRTEERDENYHNDTELDGEVDNTQRMQALTVHNTEVRGAETWQYASVDPRWYVYKQNNCITAVMGSLKKEENVVFSPFSLMSCMAMMCRGASRGTPEGMAPFDWLAIQHGKPFDQLAHYCWPTDSQSASLDDASYKALHAFVTQLTGNQACNWINTIMSNTMIEDYKHDVRKYLRAREYKTEEWDKVNKKVSDVTRMNSKVLEREPDGSVLINAIYFMDKWIYPFNDGDTGMQFRTMNNIYTNVKMMTHRRKLRIAKHGNLTAVNMLYKTPGMGAWFVKNSSEEGYQHAVAYNTLDSFIQQEFVNQTLTSSYQPLQLNIPKFDLEEKIDLKTLFKGLETGAITEIFKGGHLTRMTDDSREFFSLFRQDCILKVDQKGTKAAARTVAGTTRGGGSRPTFYNVTFAHTFYMLIYHNDTILFTAKIGCPNGNAPSGSQPPADTVKDTTNGAISSNFLMEENKLQLIDKLQCVDVSIGGKNIIMKITTKQHDGKDDTEGEDIDGKRMSDDVKVEGLPPVRRYIVDTNQLIRVTIQFETPADISEDEQEKGIDFIAVYIHENGNEEPEGVETLHFGDPYELPFPLQKEYGEGEDGWNVSDGDGNVFMKLRFRLED